MKNITESKKYQERWAMYQSALADRTAHREPRHLRCIVKGGPQPTHKIDLVHALLDALYGFDLAEGRVSE